jgi:predicted outer membrane repeat protein
MREQRRLLDSNDRAGGFDRKARVAGLPAICGWIVTGVYFGLLLAVASPPAQATSWHVVWDPNSQGDQIGGVVTQTASGDTIFIGPGTYYEHIPLGSKVLTLIGTDGAESTILDGGRPLPEREGSILYSAEGVTANLHLEGITFQHGQGQPNQPFHNDLQGGAISYWNAHNPVSDLDIRRCAFLENNLNPSSVSVGGAIFLQWIRNVAIDHCVFRANSSSAGGGAIMADGLTQLSLSDCSFESSQVGCFGGILWDGGYGGLRIERCDFTCSNFQMGGALPGFYLVLNDISLIDNTFTDYYDRLATSLFLNAEGMEQYPFQRATITGNTFRSLLESYPTDPVAVSLAFRRGQYTVMNNTFVRTPFEAGGGSVPHEFKNNIFWRGEATFWGTPGGLITCNDAWPIPMSIHPGGYTVENNISSDPLFCDEPNGDLRIAHQSPCAQDSSPPGCGLIGAQGEACDITPIERTTWGRIKSGFRR